MKRLVLFGAAAVMACMPATANASWSDDFESYPLGQIHGQGGWKGWFNDPAAGAMVVNTYSHSPTKSVNITGPSDLVHEYQIVPGDPEGDEWLYTAWQYIPTDFSGQSYFIMQNNYNDQGLDLHWSVQVRFDSSLGVMEAEFDAWQMPYITGQWVEIQLWIDLADDTYTFFYNGYPFYTKPWTAGVNNDNSGLLKISAVDLYANNASPVYYDDLSLVPVPGGACPWDNFPYQGPGDYGDGHVNIDDLFGVLGHWGPCDDPDNCPWDCFPDAGPVAGDGTVNIDDLFAILGHWGNCPVAVGACCFDTEPQCFDLLEDECLLAGGTFYGTFNSCDDFICPPPPNNDTCQNARAIEIDGASVVDDTTGMGIPGIGGCGAAGDLNTGTRFYYVIGNGKELKASLCNEGTADWNADLSIFCSYCDSLMCVAGEDLGNDVDCLRDNNVLPEVFWCSEPGVIYFIAVYGNQFASPNEGVFELTVTSGDDCFIYPTCGCDIICNGTAEGEPCLQDGTPENPTVDVTNGGCNDCFDPHHYGSITNGETVCGTVSNYKSPADLDCDGNLDMIGEGYVTYTLRDTDWYKLTIPEPGREVVVNFNAEFPGFTGILVDNCDVGVFIQTVGTADCAPVSMTIPWLYAGEYIVFVAPSIFEGIGCAYNDYSVQVMLNDIEQPECQYPSDLGTGVNSDLRGGYVAADDFNVVDTEIVNYVTVWGINAFYNGTAWGECTPVKDSFRVRYYQDTDGNGCPDENYMAEYTLSGADVNSVADGTWGTYTRYRWTLNHDDLTLPGGFCYWVEVAGQDEGNDCWFLWVTSVGGNLRGIQSDPDSGYQCPGDIRENEDQSWCIGYNGVNILFGTPWDCR
jgi:hypothetical protein